MKKAFLVFIFLSLLTPAFVFAEEECEPEQKLCKGTCVAKDTLCLNLKYPQFSGAPNINANPRLVDLVAWAYVTIVGISGLAAFVMIVWGGVQWMTSAGNPQQTGDAKDRIQKALLGLFLVLISFLV